jgi:hypothetical protein
VMVIVGVAVGSDGPLDFRFRRFGRQASGL